MKKLISTYTPFLLFLGKFLATYTLLTLCYQSYLSGFDVRLFEVDFFTRHVALQVQNVLEMFQNNVQISANKYESAINIFYNKVYIARIIEGCNSISVIILFIAFIIAFSGKFWNTFLFICFGSALIYCLNIVRIALLTALLYHYPAQEHLLHGVLFPLFIYGLVFFLWIIWVNQFSSYAKK